MISVIAPALNLVIVHRSTDDSRGSQGVTHAEFGHLLELILSARTNTPITTEVPGARDADPRFAPIVQKAVENALDGKLDTSAYSPILAAKLTETPAWKRILEFRDDARSLPGLAANLQNRELRQGIVLLRGSLER